MLAVLISGSRISAMRVRENTSSGAGCVIAGIFGLFLPVLYVLGIGPATLAANYFPETETFVSVVYFPLIFLAACCQPFDDAMNCYVDLWL